MNNHIHEDISAELSQTTRTDTITVIVGVMLNLLFMLVNSIVAGGVWTEEYIYKEPYEPHGAEYFVPEPTVVTEFELGLMLIFVLLMAAIIAINIFIVRALAAGKERRKKLTESLEKMYKEEEMGKYYDSTIVRGYETRYNLYTMIMGTLGALAVLIPAIVLTL